jgi:hypothetical protein
MQRLFAPAVILWLAAFGAAQAQTSSSVTPMPGSTTTSGTAAGTTAPGSSASTTGPTVANQPIPGGPSLNDTPSDPLNVPASTIPTTLPVPQPNSANGESTGSTVGISASPSVNPQRAAQLPGEGANASTQAPNTTAASAPSVASSTPCTSSVPTTEGASMSDVFGGTSGGGC